MVGINLALTQPQFSSPSSRNMRIMTVGIPLGFTEALKRRATFTQYAGSRADRQNDIINLCVYKVDMEYPDVVYEPLRFPFEMSRFVVRDESMHPVDATTFADYVERFPTRDYTQAFETLAGGADVQYLAPTGTQTAAFADDSYNFLTVSTRRSIIENHVLSMILEAYVRLITGLSFSEHEFDLIDREKLVGSTFAETMTALKIAETNQKRQNPTTPSSTTFLAPAPQPNPKKSPANSQTVSAIAKPTTATVATDAKKLSKPPVLTEEVVKVVNRDIPLVIQQFTTLDEFTRMITPLAESLLVTKRILTPKQFDRVFSVIFDPDDFEIDYDATISTPQGRETLNQLITRGDVITFAQNDAPGSSASTKLRVRGRDKTAGDVTLERYFVVIESFEGGAK
jgi:hypothetical protein